MLRDELCTDGLVRISEGWSRLVKIELSFHEEVCGGPEALTEEYHRRRR